MGFSTVFEILSLIWTGGVGHSVSRPQVGENGCVIIWNKNIYGDLNDFRDFRSLWSEGVEHDFALPTIPTPPPPTTTPGVANLDPRDIIDRIYVGDHQTLLHTKYVTSGLHGFREEGFWRVFSYFFFINKWPPGAWSIWTLGQDLCRGPINIATC